MVKEYKTNSWWLGQGFDNLKTSSEFAKLWLSFKLESEWNEWRRNWRQKLSPWSFKINNGGPRQFPPTPKSKRLKIVNIRELKTESWDVINMELDLKSQRQNIFLYLESPWSPLSNATRTTQFGVFYKEQCANHWRLRGLNWSLDRTQCLSKTGITPSYGIGFRRISTRWKDNFIDYPIDLLFEVCYVRN